MIKKTLTTLLLSTLFVSALEVGESIPQEIQEQLNLEQNKTYVIDFFASWCKSCKKELPLINNLYNNQQINLIGINVDKDKSDAQKFVSELSLSFPVVYDSNKKLVESFSPVGFPAIYYVKNGKIVHTIFGAVSEIDKQIEHDIEEIK